MKLNIGCGFDKRPGYVNVDKYSACSPDQVVDLEKFPWPWPDNSVSEIEAQHDMEHLGQLTECFLNIMKEIYRVLEPYGTIHITVPHPMSEGYWGDPTHVRPITMGMLGLFNQQYNKECIAKGMANTPLGLYLGIDLMMIGGEQKLTPEWYARYMAGPLGKAETEQAMKEKFGVIQDTEFTLRKIPHEIRPDEARCTVPQTLTAELPVQGSA